MSDRSTLAGILDTALEIAREQRETFRCLRKVLEKSDNDEVLKPQESCVDLKIATQIQTNL